jgi:D-Tyr-tRNA(Tyr) deacylase
VGAGSVEGAAGGLSARARRPTGSRVYTSGERVPHPPPPGREFILRAKGCPTRHHRVESLYFGRKGAPPAQFTLYGDVRRGKRPSFDAAAPPQRARELYEYFVSKVCAAGIPCATGRFQEMMQVELVNEGPVTILVDSQKGF